MTGFTIALLATAALATTYSTMSAASAASAQAKAQESSIQTRELQAEYKNTKQRTEQIQQLHTQLSENEMVMSQRGLSMASPSFNAVQMTTYNNTAQALQDNVQAQKIESLSAQSQIDSVHAISKNKQNSIFWGGIGQLASEGGAGMSSIEGSFGSPRYAGFQKGYSEL